MKKGICILLAVMLSLPLIACSNNAAQNSSTAPPQEEVISSSLSSSETEPPEQINSEENKGVSVDKGLIDVELTLPASLVGENIPTELTDEDKANGFKSFKINDDGSVTYKIAKSDYDKLIKTTYDETTANLDNLANGEDFKSVKGIKYNKDLSEITLTVDKAAYENSFDGFAVMSVGLAGSMYQVFAGVQQDKIHVEIKVQDEGTGEVFSTIIYPDALTNQ